MSDIPQLTPPQELPNYENQPPQEIEMEATYQIAHTTIDFVWNRLVSLTQMANLYQEQLDVMAVTAQTLEQTDFDSLKANYHMQGQEILLENMEDLIASAEISYKNGNPPKTMIKIKTSRLIGDGSLDSVAVLEPVAEIDVATSAEFLQNMLKGLPQQNPLSQVEISYTTFHQEDKDHKGSLRFAVAQNPKEGELPDNYLTLGQTPIRGINGLVEILAELPNPTKVSTNKKAVEISHEMGQTLKYAEKLGRSIINPKAHGIAELINEKHDQGEYLLGIMIEDYANTIGAKLEFTYSTDLPTKTTSLFVEDPYDDKYTVYVTETFDTELGKLQTTMHYTALEEAQSDQSRSATIEVQLPINGAFGYVKCKYYRLGPNQEDPTIPREQTIYTEFTQILVPTDEDPETVQEKFNRTLASLHDNDEIKTDSLDVYDLLVSNLKNEGNAPVEYTATTMTRVLAYTGEITIDQNTFKVFSDMEK